MESLTRFIALHPIQTAVYVIGAACMCVVAWAFIVPLLATIRRLRGPRGRKKSTPIGDTFRDVIPPGDILIGNLKRRGSEITGDLHVRLGGAWCFEIPTAVIRVDDQECEILLSKRTTMGKAVHFSNPFALRLSEGHEVVDIYVILKVGGKEYRGERHPIVIS